ncbi:hypothetical protein CIB48_g7943 [Xylaria polymorpha]|nr:hypothetical protein CIB48_g7943 [Xylaria polymorpha]
MKPEECWKKYINCGDQEKYRDLIVVVDKPGGWIRRDIWQLPTNQSRFWDQYIPADEPNHLVFHTRCNTGELDREGCGNSCEFALGNSCLGSFSPTPLSQDGWYYANIDRPVVNDGSYCFNGETIPEFPHDGRYYFMNPEFISFANDTTDAQLRVRNVSDIL